MGMNELIKINNEEILAVEWKDCRVITTALLAKVYETDSNNIKNNFNNHKENFIEGKHYFLLKGEELRDFKCKVNNIDLVKNNVNQLYLWTERGANRHCKILDTDKAWEQFDNLEETYFNVKRQRNRESLNTINETVKIFVDLLQRAGCSAQVQLLTAKTLIEKNTDVILPITIQSGKQYYDTEYIARKVGIHVKSSGKPAEKAVNEIIRRLNISDDMYTETWETNGKWQGTVRKYSQEVIDMVKEWCAENDYPSDIEYTQMDGKNKKYHVKWKEVA